MPVMRGIKNSLPALAIAGFFGNLIDRCMFENERDDRLWQFFTDLFDQIDAHASDSKKLINIIKPFIPESMKYKIGEIKNA